MLTSIIPAAVERIEDRTRDVRILTLAPKEKITWRAGQYMQIGIEGHGTRAYSIASAPQDSGHMTFHIRNMGGGLSAHLAGQAKPGDIVGLRGPFGDMHTGRIEKRPVLMVAGGTGIAPMLAMAQEILEQDLSPGIVLVYGARTLNDVYCRAELDALQAGGRAQVHIISDPHTPDQQLRQLGMDLRGHAVFVSGPDPMMLPVHMTLESLGAQRGQIFCDADMDALQKAAP